MKRFYCTVCKRVIRVRKYPKNISDTSSTMPDRRLGECNWHALQKEYKERNK